MTKSKVYGGPTLTTTDIAVAAKLCKIGDPNKVSSLEKSLVDDVLSLIHKIIEDSVDQVKASSKVQFILLYLRYLNCLCNISYKRMSVSSDIQTESK